MATPTPSKVFRVRWPKSKTLIGERACILEALDLQRINPGTAVYRVESTGKETAMSVPVPDAPKEPR